MGSVRPVNRQARKRHKAKSANFASLPAAAEEGNRSAASWQELPEGPLLRVLELLAQENYGRNSVRSASAVCKTWRAAAWEVLLSDTAASRPVKPPLPKLAVKPVSKSSITTCGAVVLGTPSSLSAGFEASSKRRLPGMGKPGRRRRHFRCGRAATLSRAAGAAAGGAAAAGAAPAGAGAAAGAAPTASLPPVQGRATAAAGPSQAAHGNPQPQRTQAPPRTRQRSAATSGALCGPQTPPTVAGTSRAATPQSPPRGGPATPVACPTCGGSGATAQQVADDAAALPSQGSPSSAAEGAGLRHDAASDAPPCSALPWASRLRSGREGRSAGGRSCAASAREDLCDRQRVGADRARAPSRGRSVAHGGAAMGMPSDVCGDHDAPGPAGGAGGTEDAGNEEGSEEQVASGTPQHGSWASALFGNFFGRLRG